MPKPLTQRRSPRDIEIAALSARLAEAEETLDAIRSGNVDALVVSGPDGDQIYTLRSDDHRYRRLVESMNEGAASLMPDGTVVYCNARFADLVGVPLERAMGSKLQRFVPSTSRDALRSLLAEGIRGRARGEMEIVTGSGALVPVYLSITANAVGEDAGFCLIATNLTDQKQHEQTAAAGHIAASILEQSTEAIVVCDADRRVVRSSRAAHALAQRDVLHRRFEEAFAFAESGHDAAAARMLDAALSGDTMRGIEARLTATDGAIRNLLLSAGPLLNSQDEIVGCVVSLTDITARAQAESERANLLRREQAAREQAEALAAELRASEERASLLARASAALAASLDGTMTLHNVARIGLPRLGDWCCVYLLDESLDRIECIEAAHNDPARADTLRAAIAHDRALPLPRAIRGVVASRMLRVESEPTREMIGSIAPEESCAALLETLGIRSWLAVPLIVQGRVIGAITFGSAANRRFAPPDLALAEEIAGRSAVAIDNARLFEAARRERARVEEANRAKDVFIATVSHELRTPLNAIVGWSRMLRSGTVPESKRERALETIERNAKLQTELIEGLLDISRIVSGKLRLDAHVVHPRDILETAVEASRLAADAKGVRLEINVETEIAPIVGDADRLIQVVSNLVTNAIKFTPKGGRADVSLRRDGDEIQIAVTDTGVGIGRDFLPYVFDRFRQADGATTRAHGGLGLGLAIVKHLVELHGGTIAAHSDGEGKGARFVVRLPSAPPVATSTEAVSLVPTVRTSVCLDSTSHNIAGLKVVVVDDEPDARDLLVAVLERYGVEVTIATSADEALEAVERIRPDVLLSDIAMPGTDGYALIQRVRQLEPERGGHTPAAALTAFARLEDRTRALLAGFQMHVAKPIEPAALVGMIATLAGRTE